jgi:3-hydroxybutyryl-CoA dehydratase
VTQEAIARYAEASGDYNPIHVDEVFGYATPFGGTIAHGMWVLAAITEMLAEGLGRDWLEGGSLRVRFKAPARPGDEIVTSGEMKSGLAASGAQRIEYTVRCLNQHDEELISGTAAVRVGRLAE